jgi:hypothetical protein
MMLKTMEVIKIIKILDFWRGGSFFNGIVNVMLDLIVEFTVFECGGFNSCIQGWILILLCCFLWLIFVVIVWDDLRYYCINWRRNC